MVLVQVGRAWIGVRVPYDARMAGAHGNTNDTAAPSAWVARWAANLTPGTVLDVACGGGRHSRWFAARGWRVTALDRDPDALQALSTLPGTEALQVDLEDGSPWPLRDAQYALVVVTNYLHRPLFPALAAAVAPGGAILYETFMAGNERFGKPSNPKFLLRPGELWTAFGGALAVRAFEQGERHDPKPAMVQRVFAAKA